MKAHSLKAEKRTVTGKKVKSLRKQNIIPANVFGKSRESLAIQVQEKEFATTYDVVGETGLIELQISAIKEPLHVLIHNVQTDAVDDSLIHIDFHEVGLKDKIKVMVPVKLVGESPAASQKLGVMLHLENELEVEALPTELPEEITVDITSLKEIGDEIKVTDIGKTSAYTIITDSDRTIVKINPLEKEEAPAPATTEAVEGAEPATASTPEEPKEEKTQE